MEAVFKKNLKMERITRQGLQFDKYDVIDLAFNTGARLRFNNAEILTTYLIPSERNLEFKSAIQLIDKAYKKVKRFGVSNVLTEKKLSKLSMLRSLKKLIADSVQQKQYRMQAKDLFTKYVKLRSSGSPLLVRLFTEKCEFYEIVDPNQLKNFSNESDRCYSKIPTCHDAIKFWQSAQPNPDHIEKKDDFGLNCFNEIKRIIITYLLMCKNTSEMERGFSILDGRHKPVTDFSTICESIFLRQFAKNRELFKDSDIAKDILRQG